jgi:hypothetical protein
MENLAVVLARIEAKLDRLLDPREILTAEQCLDITGCKSVRAQYRWFKDNNISPYSRGKYRRIDVANKVAHLALFEKPKLLLSPNE